MPPYLIIRQSHTPAAAFAAVKESLRHAHLWGQEDGEIPEWCALPQGTIGGENFERAAAFLEKHLKECPGFTVLVDEIDPLRLNPMRAYGWNTLIAMLILAFPELRWHFLVVTARPASPPKSAKTLDSPRPDETGDFSRWEAFQSLHGISALFQKRGTPLFDGYGLRQHVLECMVRDSDTNTRPSSAKSHILHSLPKRPKVAIVLDDETGYSHFLACMAYREGFRAHAIATWSEAEQLLGRSGMLNSEQRPPPPGTQAAAFALSLEDLFLSYPDQKERRLSDLDRREAIFPALSCQPPPIRRFLTVGHERQKETARSRGKYLRELRMSERLGNGRAVSREHQLAHKPASGMHTLWRNLGLKRAFPKDRSLGSSFPEYRHASGLAEGFVWPPNIKPCSFSSNDDDEEDSHSSPGRLVQIAEHLIHRTTAMPKYDLCVPDAVRGAVLATQAMELLGGKTPTLSLDALALKHEFEVVAECHFMGVEFHLSIRERLDEIRNNIQAMKRWIHPSRQEAFLLNSEARIVKRLISILDRYGEYEESVTCQNRLRYLHRKIRQHDEWRAKKPLRIACWPLNTYLEWVQRSFPHFVGTLLAFILFFTICFMHLGDERFSEALHRTFTAMHTVSLDGPTQAQTYSVNLPGTNFVIFTGTQTHYLRTAISYAATLFGLINFGIFISMLYSRISRR